MIGTRTAVMALALLASGAAGCVGRTDAGDGVPTFEEFAREVYREPGEREVYIVEGDLPIIGMEGLRAYYDQYVAMPRRGVHEESLLLDRSPGLWGALWVDNVQGDSTRFALSYCIGNAMPNKANVVAALARAAREWEARVNVRFLYFDDQDAACTADNGNVLFDVNLGPADAEYLARAFFPDFDRADRNILIRPDQTGLSTKTLAGLLRHELGHTLGFRHEHPRIEQDDDDCTESHSDSRELTSYDVRSVMHYQSCGGDASSNYELTPRDIQGARSVYGASNVQRVALRSSAGLFVVALDGGGGGVAADRPNPGPWEELELIGLGNGQVALRSISRRFFAAEGGGGGAVHADRRVIGPWETFTREWVGYNRIALRTSGGYYLTASSGALTATTAAGGTVPDACRFDVIRLDDRPVALRAAAGQYLRAVDGGGGQVRADTGRIWRYEVFHRVELGSAKIGLRTFDGRYLSARADGSLAADRTILGPNERFQVELPGPGLVAYKSAFGRYLTATGGGGGSVTAMSLVRGPNQAFFLVDLRGQKVSLRAANGQYLCAEDGGGVELLSNRNVVDVWETFRRVDLGGGRVALRSDNGQYVSADLGADGQLWVDRDWIDAWETFVVVPVAGGIALRADDGHFVAAEGGGGGIVVANRDQANAWETFVQTALP